MLTNYGIIAERAQRLKKVLDQKVFILFLGIVSLIPVSSFSAQLNPCDEVPITLRMDYFGSSELPALICDQKVFFSVPFLLDFLKIKNTTSHDFSKVEGFIKNQNDQFTIDIQNRRIRYNGENIALREGDFHRTKTDLYLKSSVFSEIFGIEPDIDLRSLSATITTNFELPALKLLRQKELRQKLNAIIRETVADTTIERETPLFAFGMARWNIHSIQRTDGLINNRLALGVGGVIGGGEFSADFNHSSNQTFALRNQNYRWRYVQNENNYLRQIELGKISTRSISSLFDPVVGFRLTNAPTYAKKSFGTYVLSDYTEPGWTVELYINDVLVDYAKADSAGFFSFDVPLVYGSTHVSLRYYGPWGEEKVSNRYFKIPFSFLPVGDFEYDLSAGMVEDGKKTQFAQLRTNYGLSKSITVGGGLEFLSELEGNPIFPFLNASIRFPGDMFLSGQYMNGVGFEGNFSYTSHSKIHLDLEYKKYQQDQKVIRYNYLEERQATISFPFLIGRMAGTSKISFRQNLLQDYSLTHIDWQLSGSIFGMRTSLLSTAFFSPQIDPMLRTRITTSIPLARSFYFLPQAEYDYLKNSVISVRAEVRKRIFKDVYVQASYDHNFDFDQYYFNVGFNFNLDFSRVSLSSSMNKNHTSFSQSASGGIIFDHNRVDFSDRIFLDRGSVRFIPFLDLNGNGERDISEPGVEGIEVYSNRGGSKERISGGATIFTGLEPYTNYHFKLDTRNLERIAWRIEHETMNIYLNPNHTKVVPVAVSVLGEVAGFVYDGDEGLGGIKVEILDNQGNLVTEVRSMSDGYFSYLGLPSGSYTARVDESQLQELKMKANTTFKFNIHNSEEGDYVDHLEFMLTNKKEQLVSTDDSGVRRDVSDIKPDSLVEGEGLDQALLEKVSPVEDVMGATAVVEGEEEPDFSDVTASEEEKALIRKGLYYKVQVMSSKDLLPLSHNKFGGLKNVNLEKTDSGYTYTWGKTLLPFEAARLQAELRRSGFSDAFVVHYYKGRRISPEEAIALRTNDHDTVPAEEKQLSETEKIQLSQNDKPVPKEAVAKSGTGVETKTTKIIPIAGAQNEDLLFRVQILASKVRLQSEDPLFVNLEEVEEHRHEGYYKYTQGTSRSFQEANQLKRVLRQNGFPDAFVVPFNDGKRLNPWQVEGTVSLKDNQLTGIGGITIVIKDEAGVIRATALTEADGQFIVPGLEPGQYIAELDKQQLENTGMAVIEDSVTFEVGQGSGVATKSPEFVLQAEENRTTAGSAGNEQGLLFKVQLLATVPKLPVTHRLLKGVDGIQRYRHDGLFKYTKGVSKNLEEIRKIKRMMQQAGFKDAFIVPFYNGVRMKMQEFTGTVTIRVNGKSDGLEGIRVHIYDQKEEKVTTLVSDESGRFSFLGFRPGYYKAEIDQEQLRELQLHALTKKFSFVISPNTEGEILRAIDFVLEKDRAQQNEIEGQEQDRVYKVQVAASNVPLSPNHPTLQPYQSTEMYRHEGMYKYTIGETTSLEEAQEILQNKSANVSSAFIVVFIDGKRVAVIQ